MVLGLMRNIFSPLPSGLSDGGIMELGTGKLLQVSGDLEGPTLSNDQQSVCVCMRARMGKRATPMSLHVNLCVSVEGLLGEKTHGCGKKG